MPRPGLTEEQFLEAVEVLLSNGRPVTVSAIRDVLGTGSFSTISAFLANWKERRSSDADLHVPAMPESVDRAAKTFWSIAIREAFESVKLDREALDAARKEMETEKQEIEAEISRLEAENSGLNEHLEHIQGQLTQSQADNKRLQDAFNLLNVENARLEERLKSAEEITKALQDQLDTLNETFKAALTTQPKSSTPASSSGKTGKK
jgi:dsDNA-specific endonuclease/ATPase MutS2